MLGQFKDKAGRVKKINSINKDERENKTCYSTRTGFLFPTESCGSKDRIN